MATKAMNSKPTKHSKDKNNPKKHKLSFQPISEKDNNIGQYSITFNDDDNREKFNETRVEK